jgi:hypothetical protein
LAAAVALFIVGFAILHLYSGKSQR